MMKKDMKIIAPILPGKSEAWRRFWQALKGSCRDEFSAWCEELGLEISGVWLVESHCQEAAVILELSMADPDTTLKGLDQPPTPFSRWLVQQVSTLHGIDLTALSHKTKL
jgi:hypothetical protein